MQHFELELLSLPGTYLISPFSASDSRGSVVKDYEKGWFYEKNVPFEPVESLYITSHKNTLRGLHYQRIKGQPKLVRCLKGRIWCAIVNIEKQSPTFGRWISIELSEKDGREILVPGDCALGTLALEDSLISCKCGEKMIPEYASGIKWNDQNLGIKWPVNGNTGDLIISEKDMMLQSFQDYLREDMGE